MRKFNIQDLVEVLCGATFTAKFITFFCQYNFIHTKSRKTPNLSFSVCGDTDNSHQRLAGSCSFTTAGERCPAYYTVEPVPVNRALSIIRTRNGKFLCLHLWFSYVIELAGNKMSVYDKSRRSGGRIEPFYVKHCTYPLPHPLLPAASPSRACMLLLVWSEFIVKDLFIVWGTRFLLELVLLTMEAAILISQSMTSLGAGDITLL